uniref:Uncharacterized protein n=1 Tax=Rhizophagus irregularis (strain DAOM 181602 / DAOM 197198 / MUCL 43194) TaxID=747089 RepID=U9T4W3_RHIID
MTGANVLYSTHKGTSYTLLDFNSLKKNNTQFIQLCAIVLSRDRKVCGRHKKEAIEKLPKLYETTSL